MWMSCLVVAAGLLAMSCGSGGGGSSTPIGPPGPAPGPVPPPGNQVTTKWDTNWKFFPNVGTSCRTVAAGVNLEAEIVEFEPGQWSMALKPTPPVGTCNDAQSVVFTGRSLGGSLSMPTQGSTHCMWFQIIHEPALAAAPAVLRLQNATGFLSGDGKSFSITGVYSTGFVGDDTVLCSGRFELNGLRRPATP